MSNLENYMKQQAIFCEQNDSISKNLYLMIAIDFYDIGNSERLILNANC